MKVDYAKIDDVNGIITITLEENDYADKVKKELKEIAKKHAEPGFRAGKVPAGIINKKYGKSVKYDVINKEVGNALYEYIKNEKLHVLGNPIPQQGAEFDIDAKDFELKFKVGIAPEIDTHVNKDLHVPYYKIQVTDEMVDTQDKQFRRRYGKQEPGDTVDGTALVKGVITELNEDGTVKEGGIVVENGIVAPEYFKNEDQKNIFLGKKVGDVFTFNPAATCDANPAELSSMLNVSKEDAENHKGDFQFDVKEIIVLKPAEYNEEFFKTVFGNEDIKTEEDYKKAVKELIESALANDSNYRFTIDAKNAIVDAVGDLVLPDDVLKAFLKEQNEALTEENIDEEYVHVRPELTWELIKEAIAGQFDVKVTEEDALNTARLIARQQFAQYGMMNVPEEALDRYAHDILKDKKGAQQIYNQTGDFKLFEAIRENVSADEKEVTVEEFNDLFRNDDSAE
ncbi:MAG: trigger factor [Muribaculaceae bacterium]|nr:trigger factor [Muribaculaceae bacterium]